MLHRPVRMNLSTNYAHAAGGCDLALSPDASKVFTCGSDGFICIHESKTYLQKDAGQSVTKIETEEELNCLAVNDDGELIAVGTEENTV